MIRLLILASSILLGLGLVAPTMTIYPKAGNFSWLVELVDPESVLPVTYSIVGIIAELASINDWFLVFVLSIFSIFFPIIKLYLFWVVSFSSQNSKLINAYSIASRLGKFSMAEVFVLSLALISLKTLPGGTEVNLNWGCYVYFLSVVLSIATSLKINFSISDLVQ
jgi:hypothetical protein